MFLVFDVLYSPFGVIADFLAAPSLLIIVVHFCHFHPLLFRLTIQQIVSFLVILLLQIS